MNAKSRQHEIDRFLRSGEHDLLFCDWPGEDLVERMQQGHDALIEALVSEIRRRQQELTFPIPERNLACDLASFAREKFASMVHGLFPRREWAPVLAVLERSVVFLTADTIESLIPQTNDLGTAREVASIFLASIGAQCLDDEERNIVGYSVESTCYVSIDYFACDDPYADYVVHEAAHLFHNTRRTSIGLPETRHQQWLLPIDFRKRETFAYAVEAYSRICELSKKQAERRSLLAELVSRPPPLDDRVDPEEYLDILSEAIGRRNGWKAILNRCAQQAAS
jgi:hypothetical protein